MEFDHVALLVRDIGSAVDALRPLGVPVGPVRDFPAEGTREAYVGEETRPGRLLLMQPAGDDGPYARALERRGPGLHHVAVNVPDLEAFLDGVAGSGWLVHPTSFRTIRDSRTAWLARSGVGTLVEVHEASVETADGPPVVTAVEVPATLDTARLFAILACAPLAAGSAAHAHVTVGSARLRAVDLAPA